jgi:hypothetical protein
MGKVVFDLSKLTESKKRYVYHQIEMFRFIEYDNPNLGRKLRNNLAKHLLLSSRLKRVVKGRHWYWDLTTKKHNHTASKNLLKANRQIRSKARCEYSKLRTILQ